MTFRQYKEEILKDQRSQNLNFSLDGRIHYVYRVTELFGDGLHYIGIHTDDDTTTLGTKYYTSSRNLKFKNNYRANPSQYKSKIIQKFNNRGDAALFECYLHQKFMVKDNAKFFNISNQLPFSFAVGLGRNHPFAREVWQIAIGRTQEEPGSVVAKFATIKEARVVANITSINQCAKKSPGVKTASNYLWVYPEDYDKSKILQDINKGVYLVHELEVWQIAIGRTQEEPGSVVAKFDSMVIAAEVTGFNRTQIGDCAKKKTKC